MIACNSNQALPKDYAALLNKKENAHSAGEAHSNGQLIRTIACNTKTSDLKDFPDGKIPWVDIKNNSTGKQDIIDATEVVIKEHKITVQIDYPLNKPYSFELSSANGFTRAQLIQAIIDNYNKIYQEEEATAIVKTVPLKERKGMSNRNETNGKYGIWGHDIDDLSLSEIEVYRAADGKITLGLGMES